MQKFFVGLVFIIILLSSCSLRPNPSATTSIRFTPLNFPYSNLGEFTLTDTGHKEQIDVFLNVISSTLTQESQSGSLPSSDLNNTFSLQLFTGDTLTSIYRLSFDFDNDTAYLEDVNATYQISKKDFYQLMETGYFNVIFHKNYAPNAGFQLNGIDVKYAVTGTWNYETYQNNFLSYQINKKPDRRTNYIVTDEKYRLQYFFPEKQPDQIFETIATSDSIILPKTLLTSENITIPNEENKYYYEIEAVWNNTDLPYRAVLTYRFEIEVNYPANIRLPQSSSTGSILPIIVENYDSNGKISISSPLWKDEVILGESDGKYYGILPIPHYAEPGEYEIYINGKFSNEFLQKKVTITINSSITKPKPLKGKLKDRIDFEQKIDDSFNQLVQKAVFSSPEKLWNGKFATPTTTAPSTNFGSVLQSQELLYQYFRLGYPKQNPFEVRASESGIVRVIDSLGNDTYSLLIDHGLSVFSIYYGVSELEVGLGNYIVPKQKIGSFEPNSTNPDLQFHYTMIANGYYINPNAFRNRDPFSIFK